MDKEQQKKLIIEIMNEDAKDGLYKKQTAIEYLVEQLFPKALSEEQYYHIDKAKEMEKKQIMQAYALGHVFHDSNDSNAPEFYYNTEYGKQ